MIEPVGCISQPPRVLGKLIKSIPVFVSFLAPMAVGRPDHQFVYHEFLNAPPEDTQNSETEKSLTEQQRPAIVVMTNQRGDLRINRSATNTITWAGSIIVSCEVNRQAVVDAATSHPDTGDSPTDDDIEMIWTNFAGQFFQQIIAGGDGNPPDGEQIGIYLRSGVIRSFGRVAEKERSGKGDYHGISFTADWGFGDGV